MVALEEALRIALEASQPLRQSAQVVVSNPANSSDVGLLKASSQWNVLDWNTLTPYWFTDRFCIYVTGFGSKRFTHGTTTLSNAEEDYDRKQIGDKIYYIKPKSLYPDRDDGREKQEGDVQKTLSHVNRKFSRKIWLQRLLKNRNVTDSNLKFHFCYRDWLKAFR